MEGKKPTLMERQSRFNGEIIKLPLLDFTKAKMVKRYIAFIIYVCEKYLLVIYNV